MQSVFLSKKNSKIKLGTLNFNNMKTVKPMHGFLEKLNMMENFIVGKESHKVKDYLLTLIVDDIRTCASVE